MPADKKELTPREAIFVREYILTSHSRKSALAAGCSSEAVADSQAYKWLNDSIYTHVQKAIQDEINKLKKVKKFDQVRAMEEADRLQAAAEEAGNLATATALFNLKCKLAGLMVEKVQVSAGFSLSMTGFREKPVEITDVTPVQIEAPKKPDFGDLL